MQKRLVRKIDLEILLSQIKLHPSPKPSLEQYTIPADVAATILYIAAYTYNDIIDKTVIDLGCGTGRLALGAAFLGAKQVVGVDISRTAVRTAYKNSEKTGLKNKVQWVITDINAIHGKFNTVLQNPPFGVQRRKA
ncbi:methyltransferase, partial [Candidatus Bathyarchaeota archaeon]|nr:methyltransferase [Candidatus Bathyarchaeota archaeon]